MATARKSRLILAVCALATCSLVLLLVAGWRRDSLDSFSRSRLGQMVKASSSRKTSQRPSATFVSLVRNRELDGILQTMQTLESTFNNATQNRYPYVFLNDEPFTPEFMHSIRSATQAEVTFDLVPQETWRIPDFIDMDRARAAWDRAAHKKVLYGGSQSYRQMCRFFSGFMARHAALRPYRYYWRIEPDTRFLCNLGTFDPFRFMRDEGKVYGFVITLLESPGTIRTLGVHVLKWLKDHGHLVHPNSAYDFAFERGGVALSTCHFWSNFEIADLDFFRGEAYQSYFDYLDRAGGFFYERWGDAPVHSIAASLLLDKSQIHHFDNIGYWHPPYQHCPSHAGQSQRDCFCLARNSINAEAFAISCMPRWRKVMRGEPI